MSKVIYIIAGEPSGDFIGSLLMKSLKEKDNSIIIKGIGGYLMQKEGLESLFHINKISIMGLFEVLKSIFTLKLLINKTIKDIIAVNPDVIITIDSLGFNKRVIKKVKKIQEVAAKKNSHSKVAKLVHYVAPTVWAWKPSRAKKVAKLFDYLLCLFEFELPYFQKHNIPTFFVGHPIVEINFNNDNVDGVDKLFKTYNIKTIDKDLNKYLLLLPGSREGEITKILPIFMKIVDNLKVIYPDMVVFISTLPHLKDKIIKILGTNNNNYIILTSTEEKHNSYKIANLALAASGTVTLELALANVKTIVAYKVNPLTALLAKMLIKVKYASIINIIAQKEIIPEFIQNNFKVNTITNQAIMFLNNKYDYYPNKDLILEILTSIGYNNFVPSKIASDIVCNILNNNPVINKKQ